MGGDYSDDVLSLCFDSSVENTYLKQLVSHISIYCCNIIPALKTILPNPFSPSPFPLLSPFLSLPLTSLSLPLSSHVQQMYQVYTTFINKTTGQLSVITSYMNWSGTAARIFTTVQETQDPIILMMYTSSFIVNSIIMLQFGIYWNASSSKDSEKKEK